MDALCLSVDAQRQPELLAKDRRASALRRRVADQRPELDPDSTCFQAAVLLLSAVHVGQNVDRVARFTGVPRDVVARCARRLVDNGVWHGGRTDSSWCEGEELDASFWSDVAVAEGKLCRRRDENGVLRWAPPGCWRKSYSFVDEESAQMPWVSYETPMPAAAAAADPVPERVRGHEEDPRDTAPIAAASRVEAELVLAGEAAALGLPRQDPRHLTVRACESGSIDLFPGAAWLH